MRRPLLAALVLSAVLAGCSTPTSLVTGGAAADAPAPVALPPGATVRVQDSLVMGSGDTWVGRVVANVGSDTGAAYRYFLDTYPAQGWTLLSSVRARTSLLVFARQDRTATVELTEGGVGSGATATVTVTPRATASSQGVAPATAVPAGPGPTALPAMPTGSTATSAPIPAAPRRAP